MKAIKTVKKMHNYSRYHTYIMLHLSKVIIFFIVDTDVYDRNQIKEI